MGRSDLRPCLVKDQKALFHKWEEIYQVVPPSPLKGGHPGGQISFTRALVEWEDGTVDLVKLCDLRFMDHPLLEYCFERGDNNGDTQTQVG